MNPMTEWLFSWEVVSVIVALAISIGLGVLALSDYKLAKLFFLIAAADATGGVLMWGRKSELPHWAIGLIVFAAVGGIAVVTLRALWYVDSKKSRAVMPVTVTPDHIEFQRVMSGVGSTYVFTIRSNSDADLYSVVTKIGIESLDVARSDYLIDADEQNRRVIYDEKDGQISDPIILGITDNDTHFPSGWVLIYRLKSHESREIRVRVDVKNEPINVVASVAGFETTPQALVSNNGRLSFRFLDKWIYIGLGSNAVPPPTMR